MQQPVNPVLSALCDSLRNRMDQARDIDVSLLVDCKSHMGVMFLLSLGNMNPREIALVNNTLREHLAFLETRLAPDKLECISGYIVKIRAMLDRIQSHIFMS